MVVPVCLFQGIAPALSRPAPPEYSARVQLEGAHRKQTNLKREYSDWETRRSEAACRKSLQELMEQSA